MVIDECAITLYDIERELWKGINKAQLIQYYHNISEYLLPYIRQRPQSLHIKLNSAVAPGMYIKDMEGRQPSCADVFKDRRRHKAEGKRDEIDYLVCNNAATLVWMVNLGCVDINPWSSRVSDPDKPDYLIIDLDPSEEKRTAKGLNRLRETALAASEYCDSKGLKTFIKTSGKTGIHFLVPCSGLTFTQARAITEQICEGIRDLVPRIATTEISISQRGDKVFIDPSQNDYADTIAAPYSVRPFFVPSVSTPVEARELKNIDPHDFTIETIFERIEKKGDLFTSLFDASKVRINTRALKVNF